MQSFTKKIKSRLGQSQQKLWSSGRALGSQLEGCGFNPCPMLDGSGVKAMPGPISAPNFGSLQKIRKIQLAKWGTRTKKDQVNLKNYIIQYCTFLLAVTFLSSVHVSISPTFYGQIFLLKVFLKLFFHIVRFYFLDNNIGKKPLNELVQCCRN